MANQSMNHVLPQVWKLVCADAATLALTLDGEVYHWGHSWLEQDDGGWPPTTNPEKISELKDVTAIACTPSGYYHERARRHGYSCAAITSNGALFTWGRNDCGQLLHTVSIV